MFSPGHLSINRERTMSFSYQTATSTENFINSLGVNTHIDFSSYSNISAVENAINYLGIKNLRDSANSPKDLGANGLWQQVANATGAKFDAFATEGSIAKMEASFNNGVTLAKQGIVNFLEGGNEEDQSYAVSLATAWPPPPRSRNPFTLPRIPSAFR